MVTLNEIEKDLNDMAEFYISLPSNVTNESDKANAWLAKDSAEEILKVLKRYKVTGQNKYLKRLDANLMTLSRGVEQFHDERINDHHRSYSKIRHQIFQWLENEMKS